MPTYAKNGLANHNFRILIGANTQSNLLVIQKITLPSRQHKKLTYGGLNSTVYVAGGSEVNGELTIEAICTPKNPFLKWCNDNFKAVNNPTTGGASLPTTYYTNILFELLQPNKIIGAAMFNMVDAWVMSIENNGAARSDNSELNKFTIKFCVNDIDIIPVV